MELKYKIEFYSEWHCGSGLTGGAETDADVIKDKNDLPYVPGKTIKGLLRWGGEEFGLNNIEEVFGSNSDAAESASGNIHVSNATLCETEANEIIYHQLQPMLYKSIGQTKINDKGVASDKSLRVKQVCMPLTLNGTIEMDEKYKSELKICSQMIKNLGINRNRGLGRCKISIDD